MNGDSIGMDPQVESDAETAKQFYVRFCRFLAFLSAFFVLVIISQYEQESLVVFFAVMAFSIGISYMLGSLAITAYVNSQRHSAIHNILTDEELEDIEGAKDDEEGQDDSKWMLANSFEKTPSYVRACLEPVSYVQPKDGRYKVVYNAVYFGKSIRSESQLDLCFKQASGRDGVKNFANGWEIRGGSVTGNSNKAVETIRPISEGFLNARGELYWKLESESSEIGSDGIYRGSFDLQSNSLFDGDFKAGGAPPGRIVRLEFLEGAASFSRSSGFDNHEADSWGSVDVEMINLGK